MLLALGVLAACGLQASASLTPWDTPTIGCVTSTARTELTVNICAGPSGALAGFTLQWQKASDYVTYGWNNPDLCALSLSGQPSYMHDGASRWDLGGGECQTVTIGAIDFDETGVSGNDCAMAPLECGKTYVFRAFAHAGRGMGRSDWTGDLTCSTAPCPSAVCVHSQGFWKNHGGPSGICSNGGALPAWPYTSLTLGTVSYDQTKLCTIMNTPASGGCLISLAHQLIAARFNVAIGAECPGIEDLMDSADALIADKNVMTVVLKGKDCGPYTAIAASLQAFNEGTYCAGQCHQDIQGDGEAGHLPTEAGTWGHIKALYK